MREIPEVSGPKGDHPPQPLRAVSMTTTSASGPIREATLTQGPNLALALDDDQSQTRTPSR